MVELRQQAAGSLAIPGWSGLAAQGRRYAGLAAVFLIWEAMVRLLGVPEYLLPAPSRLLATLVAEPGLFLGHTVPTVLEAFGGFVVGNLFGLAVAIAFSQFPTAQRALTPLMVALRTLPIVAITPLLTLILGRGAATLVTVAALVSFFPTFVGASRGLALANRETLELMRLLSASRWQTLVRVQLPYALPYLCAAFRISATACVLGAMVAEWLAADRGLGFLIEDSRLRWKVPQMWAGIAITTALAVISFGVTGWIERRVRWWTEEGDPAG